MCSFASRGYMVSNDLRGKSQSVDALHGSGGGRGWDGGARASSISRGTSKDCWMKESSSTHMLTKAAERRKRAGGYGPRAVERALLDNRRRRKISLKIL